MNDKARSMVKITQPQLTDCLLRPRLFSRLDEAVGKPLVWLMAPAGAGKTTLVSSYLSARQQPCLWYQLDGGDADPSSFFYYMGHAAARLKRGARKPLPALTPEYMLGIPVFTRRYFEQLFLRLKTPHAIVLDNYQDVAPDSPFHEILRHGLEVSPEGITFIVCSRSGPPAQLARLRTHSCLATIGWDDIRFTEEESSTFLRDSEASALSARDLQLLHERSDGWAAGLVLMAEHAKTHEPGSIPLTPRAPQELFDYFANEVFERTDKETQALLLATALLPSVNPRTAQALTDNPHADAVLSLLHRHHYFTDLLAGTGCEYRYHPLFREFLHTRAKQFFAPTELIRLHKRATALLTETGQIEAAAELLHQAAEWEDLAAIIACHAPVFMAQGRIQSLTHWLTSIPEEVLDHEPWLLYWQGICAIPIAPDRSGKLLDRAFAEFQHRNDEAGTLMAWSAAVDFRVHEWHDYAALDPLIDWFETRVRDGKSFPAPHIEARVTASMAGATMVRRTYTEARYWIDRAQTLTQHLGDQDLYLQTANYAVQFSLMSGENATARIVLAQMAVVAESKNASPLMRLLHKAMSALVEALCMDGSGCVPAAIAAAEESGIYLFESQTFATGLMVAINDGDTLAASTYLEKMRQAIARAPRKFASFHFHMMSGLHSLLTGAPQNAAAHLGQAELHLKDDPQGISMPRFTLYHAIGQVACAQKEFAKAEKYFALAHAPAAESNSAIAEFMLLLAKANLAFETENNDKGINLLRKGMCIGRRHAYVTMLWWWQADLMSKLCSRALAEGIEPDYVGQLIRRRKIAPPVPAPLQYNWPFPVSIQSFGNLEIKVEDQALAFTGKVQQKPLSMLKALIADGGTAVPEERLTYLLWPDAEGDLAHKSFEMTLLRLRRLLGNERAIQLNGSKLSLDPTYCMLDIWRFEEAFRTSEEFQRTAGNTEAILPPALEKLIEAALQLYHGHFLATDQHLVWAKSMREKMRNRHHSLVIRLGQHYFNSQQWAKARTCFERGLLIDELSEEFYQHLMRCFERCGLHSEVARVYARCKEALATTLGIKPSAQTEAIYAQIHQC